MTDIQLTATDIREFPKEYRRNLINCLSGFKSLCLCGSIDSAGQHNLSLISSVIHVGANPPLLGMLMRPHVVPRHTLENIEQTGFFTLNHVSEGILKQAHQTSANYPKEVSEFEATGLTPLLSALHTAPYVAESSLRIGLKFTEKHLIEANGTEFIVGEIVEIQTQADAIGKDGFLDLDLLGSLSVTGLYSYHRSERVARFAYARPGKDVTDL